MFSTVLLSQILLLTLLCHGLCYEPTEEDFRCFNDYETEMKCSFRSDSLISCSEYKLKITHTVVDSINKYTCIFESRHSARCECNITVQGFVLTEEFTTTLLKGTNVALSKTFMTMYFIKPKTPVLSVQKIENGNFNVTWDNKYETREKLFTDGLTIHLTYRTEGGHETVSKNVSNSRAFYEIVGTNLQPNTNYILTARMSTDYNDHKILSDESAPVEFTSSSSSHELVKVVVPALCVGLILIIVTIFICVLRMKMNWWDKISKPKIDANLGEEKGHILPPSIMNFSPIHVEITKLDFQEEKKLISASSVDTNNEKSSHSVESAAGDYGQAGFDSGSDKENCSAINVSSHVNHALEEDFKSFLTNNTPSNQGITMVDKSVGISSSRERNRANRDSGNCSGSSVLYLESDVSLNLSNDVDADEKLIVKNSLYPSLIVHDGSVTPSDDGYQAFEGLTKSTEGQWSTSIRTEQALNECGALKFPHSTCQDLTSSEQQSLRATSLHFSPIIQIDMSYQSV